MAVRKRRGPRAADQLVVAIEALKATLRLALMKTTRGRTGLNPPVPEREIDPSVLDLHRPTVVGDPPNARISFTGEGEAGPEGGSDEYWTGSRTGLERPTIKGLRGVAGEGDPASVQQFLKKRVLTVENATRPEDLVGRTKGLGKVAEVIWILRPLVYGSPHRPTPSRGSS